MSNVHGLSPEARQGIREVFAKYPQIKRVILYGSRELGTERPGSDIDLTLDAPELKVNDLLKIENQLDDLMLPHKIDLSLLHLIDNPSLLEHIQRVGKFF